MRQIFKLRLFLCRALYLCRRRVCGVYFFEKLWGCLTISKELLINEDIKDNSLTLSNSSMGSETKDDINDFSNEIENVNQYRHMLKRFKSGTVHEKSHDTETILTNERFAKDYSGLASKVLVPLKKNSCVDPMIVPLCEDIVKENKEFNYYEKRCPKMRRGYSILDILELTCNKK